MGNTQWSQYQHWHLVGIKGVAMAALAQCLRDAGKTVTGCDVAEDFVTAPLLTEFNSSITVGFAGSLPSATEVVVYTAAHQGQFNPQVQAAKAAGLVTVSHAEALGWLFNDKAGIAVCGVGGKSTTSAMIAWILEKTGHQPSYAIGVGGVPGLEGTGKWLTQSQYFVAEADEYVIDASAPSRQEPIVPRFSFLQPQITVCTNLTYDHPDVYRDFEHTQTEFGKWFAKLPAEGWLIANARDKNTIETIQREHHLQCQIEYVGDGEGNAVFAGEPSFAAGWSRVTVLIGDQTAELKLRLPGVFNLSNALMALTVTTKLQVPLQVAVASLAEFRSTKRRAEYIGTWHGVPLYDDYAHHPHEVEAIITAFRHWYPEHTLVVAFQSHTFSRTKQLFDQFVTAFDQADHVVMTDIFPSAREAFDPSVTSDQLCAAINRHQGKSVATNYHTLTDLAVAIPGLLTSDAVLLTVGAGDIYQLYTHLSGISYD